jgi:hypothetical protein
MNKLAMIVTLALSTSARAEPWHPSAEVGPLSTIAFGGYLVDAGVRAPALPHTRFVAAAFGLEVPASFLGDDNTGWHRHDNGFGIGAEHELGLLAPGGRGGVFVALYLAGQQKKFSRTEGSVTIREADTLPQVGFRYFAFRGGFVSATFGVVIPLARDKDAAVAGMTFHHKPVDIVPSINFGWEL